MATCLSYRSGHGISNTEYVIRYLRNTQDAHQLTLPVSDVCGAPHTMRDSDPAYLGTKYVSIMRLLVASLCAD
jgi:hypothetical protein